jgi:hypothetical protein
LNINKLRILQGIFLNFKNLKEIMGIGDWGLGPIPNPQSPIPNPQSPYTLSSIF